MISSAIREKTEIANVVYKVLNDPIDEDLDDSKRIRDSLNGLEFFVL